jgi:hypothetical protein
MGAVGFKADAQNEKTQISAVKVRLQQKGSRTAEVDALTSHVSVQTGVTGQQEPFVDAKAVAAFLSISRDDVLRLTREGKIRGYAYKGHLRHVYRYRLSEVSEDFAALAYQPKGTIPGAALVRQRRKSNG